MSVLSSMTRILTALLLAPLSAVAQIPMHQFTPMDATAAMAPQESRSDTVEPDFRAFSSMEATGDGRIIYWGGGHGDYGGNDMDVYHAASNEWRQETYEENWKEDLDSWDHLGTGDQPTKEKVRQVYGSGPVADYLTGRGRPGTRHSYQQATWWPEKGWFVFDFKHSLWAWDPDQGDANGAFMKIHDINANQGYADIQFWNIRYDPPSGSLVSFNNGDGSAYRLKDGTWQKVMDTPFEGYKGEIYSEFHGADQVHYAARWSNLYIADLEAKTFDEIPDSPPAAAGNNQWLEYSPEREQMLVMGFDADGLGVWGYNPETQEWENADVTGEVMRPDGNPITNNDIRWDMLERDPVSGNYYFLSFRKGAGYQSPDTYAFRLAEDAGQPAPADPSQHPDNEWVELEIPDGPDMPYGNGKDFQMEYVDRWGDVFIGFGDWSTRSTSGSSGREAMYRFDAENNDWTVLQGHCPDDLHQDGWDEVMTAYDSKRGHIWGFPGYMWGGDCGGGVKGRTMYWDVATQSWNNDVGGKLFTHPTSDAMFGDYDPPSDRVWGGSTWSVVRIDHTLRDDPATEIDEFKENAVTSWSADSGDNRFNGRQIALDVKGRSIYLPNHKDGRRSIVRFDMEDKSFSGPDGITQIPEEVPLGNNNYTWNPERRVFMFPVSKCDSGDNCRDSGELYVYHVDTAQWQYHDIPHTGENPVGNSAGFDRDNELLIIMGQRWWPEFQDVFALQYVPRTTGVVESWVDGEPAPEPEPEPEPEPTVHTLAISGSGPTVEYAVEFENAPTKNGEVGSINDEDAIDGTTATGHVVSGIDAYDYEGAVVSCTVGSTADVTVSVDDQVYDGCTEPAPEPDSPQITLTGGDYHVTVAGEVISDHVQLKEAVESSVNAMLSGKTDVEITRDSSRVEQSGLEPSSSRIAITGGMYHVTVNDEVVSDHYQIKEAVQSAVNALLADDQATVSITRDASTVEIR